MNTPETISPGLQRLIILMAIAQAAIVIAGIYLLKVCC